MTLSVDDDLSAAEYALGTLDSAERTTLAARRQREPELDEAISTWELRLGPLTEVIPSTAPPRDYLMDILRRISDEAPANDNVVADLTRRLRRWRVSAIAAASIAAALAIGIGLRENFRPATPHEFVAVLQKSADAPAFIVTVNIDTRSLTVRPVAAPAQPDKAYELWIIDTKLGAPRSLGVLDQKNPTAPNLSAYDPAVVQSATYAVTVEQPGGSPTGQPTSAPVFVGKLIPTGP
jgi:anti-sigma-K factor RskA